MVTYIPMIPNHQLHYKIDKSWVSLEIINDIQYLNVDGKLFSNIDNLTIYNDLTLQNIKILKRHLSPNDPKGNIIYSKFEELVKNQAIIINNFHWILFEKYLFINQSVPSCKNGLKVWLTNEPYLPGTNIFLCGCNIL